MNAIRTAILQPITVTVSVILALVAGFVALDRVPVQMTPDVDDTVVAVTTRWENASPQEVESEVVDEQEEKLQSVAGLRSMVSTSQRGQGVIRLEFVTGTPKEVALREVSDKLREVPSYPADVDEPVVEATDPESRDYIAWMVVTCGDASLDVRTLFDFFDKRVKPRLERIPGIAEVGLLGGREREAQIRFDPVRLAQRQVTVPQLVAALRANNQNYSAGALEQGKTDIRVRTVGRFGTPEQVLDSVIRQDASGIVRVRDVAEVVEDYKEPDSFVRSSGRPAMAMNFQREPGSNVLVVMEALQGEIEALSVEGGLLDSQTRALGLSSPIRVEQVYDQTEYVYQALDLVQTNILIGGALAILMLLLFLRSLRTVGIIAVAIPISVVGSIVVMVTLGRSINVISLAGMAFAVGMVVDNAIVVIENIFRHLEMGKKPARAALDGTTEVAGAVLASTLTTLVVFIPILMIQESAGQLFRDIALAICAAVGLSFLVSVLVIPSGAALLLKQRNGDRSGRGEPSDDPEPTATRSRWRRAVAAVRATMDLPTRLGELVYAMLGSRLVRVVVILVFVLVSIGGTIWLVPPVDYLPKGNRNIVFAPMTPPPGYKLDQMHELGLRVEHTIAPFWERSEVPESELPAFPTGMEPDAPTVVPPKIVNYFLVARDGNLFHGGVAEDAERAIDLIPLFQAAMNDSALPGTLAFAFQFPLFRLGGSTGSAVKIDLSGSDLGEVVEGANALFGELFAQFGPQALQPAPSNFNLPARELQIVPDLVRMSEVGLQTSDLGIAVQVNSDGALIGDYEYDGGLIDLKVIADVAVDQNDMSHLGDVPIATPAGPVVELENVTDFRWVDAPEQIRRVGRQRAVTLEFTPPADVPLQDALGDLQATVGRLRESGAILPTVDVSLAGTASKLDEILGALLGDGTLAGLLTSSLFLALFTVYLLMCVLFQSWVYPLVILFSVPLATFGGFLGLAWVHAASVADRYAPVQNLDVLTILGFVILAGVVVNNAILIVSQALSFWSGRSDAGVGAREVMTPRRAIALSVQSRVRPIFMSMLTSVGGMLPLVLMPGSGSELYRGLGAVVVGGLVVSTLFTLLLVPMVLGFVFEWSKQRSERALELDDVEERVA